MKIEMYEGTITVGDDGTITIEDESYLFPKECREIAKEKTLPTEEEIKYIYDEYGVNVDRHCKSMTMARITHQKLAWKAINYQTYKKEYLTTLQMVQMKEVWYNMNG